MYRHRLQILEVRIDSVEHLHDDVSGSHDNDESEEGDDEDGVNVDIATRPHTDSEPLLLVFSNDRRRRHFDSRDLHEMELYESGDLPVAAVSAGIGVSDYDEAEYVDVDDDDAFYYDDRPPNGETERHVVVSRVERDTAPVSDVAAGPPLHAATRQDLSVTNKTSSSATRPRVKRAPKFRRRRRNICRRRPMYVNFQDIHWDGWIIEPRGYQV